MLYLTGIHDAGQLPRFDPSTWVGIRRRIAIDLIDDIDRLGDPAVRVALFERIVDVRGAFKRTYPDRFAEFDARLIEAWRAKPPANGTVHVLDAAVSDGSTSLSLMASVEKLTGGDFRFSATDLDGRYQRLSRKGAPQRRVIATPAGEIVQIVTPPFLFTHRESKLIFPVNRMLRPAAQRWADALVADWRRGDASVQARDILLLAPQLRHRVETDARVQFRAWDILEPWPGDKAHCVRAMNVLNHGYFDDAQMATVMRHLFDALADGGLIAMGSNEDAGTSVDGIVCRRVGDGLEAVESVGRGFRAPDVLARFLKR